MSLNETPLQVVQEIEPVVNMAKLNRRQYAVLNGGGEISYQTYLSQNVNNNTIQITTLPPDQNTIIDPMQIKAHVDYEITFTGTSTSGNLIQLGTADCPRYMPFNNTCNTQQVQINGQSISTLTNQWLPALSRYQEYAEKLEKEFTAPTQLDKCVEYADLFGKNSSPMALFGESDYQQSRGGFSGITIVSNTPTAAVVRVKTTEPVLIPAIYYNKYGLCNVRNLSWLFTFGDLRRVWCHDSVNGNNITNVSVNITAFSMSFRFITPKILSDLPKNLVYSYHEIVPMNQSTATSIAPAGTTRISISSVNLQAIPKALIFWVGKDQSAQSYTDADSFFRIDSISVNWMNRTGLLSSATVETLYDICHNNGYNGDWDMYNKYNGSVVKLVIGKDIGLSSLFAPGLLTNPQLSLTVNCTNLSSIQTITPTLYVQAIYEGTMEIGADGSMRKSTAVLSSSDVLNSQLASAPVVESKSHTEKSYFGGSLLDDLVAVGKDLVNVARHSVDAGMKIAPMLGAGVIGGRKPRKGRRGGDLVDRDDLMASSEEYYE